MPLEQSVQDLLLQQRRLHRTLATPLTELQSGESFDDHVKASRHRQSLCWELRLSSCRDVPPHTPKIRIGASGAPGTLCRASQTERQAAYPPRPRLLRSAPRPAEPPPPLCDAPPIGCVQDEYSPWSGQGDSPSRLARRTLRASRSSQPRFEPLSAAHTMTAA